eukprot:scaffold65463_cov63-Phaeocystis_antarctica.AAC.1
MSLVQSGSLPQNRHAPAPSCAQMTLPHERQLYSSSCFRALQLHVRRPPRSARSRPSIFKTALAGFLFFLRAATADAPPTTEAAAAAAPLAAAPLALPGLPAKNSSTSPFLPAASDGLGEVASVSAAPVAC